MPAISTFFGFVSGSVLFLVSVAIATDEYGVFYSLPSIFLVFGGTMAATFISYDSRDIFGTIGSLFLIFYRDSNKESLYRDDVKLILELSNVQRTEGRIALENSIPKKHQKNAFISFAVDLVISNYKPVEIRMMLTAIMSTNFDKGYVRSNILKTMAGYAPAFGMVGTIIGLVIVLGSFGGDISQLGSGLSLALVTTLYGVLSSNFLFNPAAEKIARKADHRQYREQILLEGFVLLAERKSGLAIQDKLNSLLNPQFRYKSDASKP